MLIHWQTPVTFNGLTAGQILTNTMPGAFFEAAFFGNASSPIYVTNNGVVYPFYSDGSTVSLADYWGTASGCWLVGGNTTGNTNLDKVLNQFAWDGGIGTHTLTLHNLTPGSNYCVQIFALDDRGAGAGRYSNFQDPANNADVSDTVGMQDNKYVIGTFTAPGTDLAILQNLLPGGAANTGVAIVGTVGWTVVNTNPPTANFAATLSGQTLQFSWAADHQGWQLYTNAVGLGATSSWFPVPGSANSTSQSITLDPTKPNVFFQLRYP